jgi:CxxC motif-containing protein (DUF1111 family)
MGSFTNNLLAACSTIALTATVAVSAATAQSTAAASTAAVQSNPAATVNATTGVPSGAPSNFEGSAAGGVSDPGVRGGAIGVGGPLPGLNSPEVNFFFASRVIFQEVDSVNGTVVDADVGLPTAATGIGLGPSFNGNACAQCHFFPAIGGSSPPTNNPQITLATLDGAKNTIPPFVANGGPIREARFVNNAGGSADGGVHDLYVITGRKDATNQANANAGTTTTCTVPQTNFPAQIAKNNVIFRIPTPTFGTGLVENIGELTLAADAVTAGDGAASKLGITVGRFNHSGNDGTITRFGWKAQNKSLLIFTGEAYNVEQGVTSEAFPNERTGQFQSGGNNQSNASITNCLFNGTPEDSTEIVPDDSTNSPAADFSSDVVKFAGFMRFSAPPAQGPTNASTNAGFVAFENIGCGICHIVFHTTDGSVFTNQSRVQAGPLSDFALHSMGSVLQDRIGQGGADGNDFRSAPLWGIGQRAFFLHDGRTNNLVTAIEDHASAGSEANAVISSFNQLPAISQQNIINFLRSL